MTCEPVIPFGAIGAPGWNKSCHHLCGFLAAPIELGYLYARIEEETHGDGPSRVDHDEVMCRLSMRSRSMRRR